LVQANGSGEPSVISSGAWTYADAPEGSTVVWRRQGDKPWQPGVATTGSSGDSDVAVDGDGVLYASDLLDAAGSNAVSVSFNHGATFRYKTVVIPQQAVSVINTSGGTWDRQWMVAWGHGQVVTTAGYFASLLDTTEVEHAWVSTDRGRTYDGPFTATPPVVIAGKLTRGPDGRLYLPYQSPAGIGVATSTDGRHWQQHMVAPGVQTDGFPSVATDSTGTVYLTWVAVPVRVVTSTFGLAVGGAVQVASSKDGARTWSPPVTVSDTARTAVFSAVVAGTKGRVAVLYYAARAPIADTGPDLSNPLTQWDIDIAESANADRPNATWTRSVAVADVHQGSICTEGVGCASPEGVGLLNLPLPYDRRLLDFFGATVRPDGRVVFVYPTDRPPSTVADLLLAAVDVRSATQVSGPRLK
jgi:hypothetical protein